MSPKWIFNYVQPNTPQYSSTNDKHKRAYNNFSHLSQESIQQTTERKTGGTHQHQQWTTLQAPSLNSMKVIQTMKSSSNDASGGSQQPALYSTMSKTFKSQRTTPHLNYPLPLDPEEIIQMSAPLLPTSLKSGCTIEYWNEQAKPKDIMQDMSDLNEWIWTCTTLLKESKNIVNSWLIPAFLSRYNDDILTSSDKFLNFILWIINIPFAIGTNTVNNWFTKIREWYIKSTDKPIKVWAPFPKCDVLHAFLYNARLWDPRGEDKCMEHLTNKLCITFINSQE